MTQKTNIENTTRQQIAVFLPRAIELAVRSYHKFMMTEEDFDKDGNIQERNFAEHHKSAKIAISHIELLIKLAKWADLPDQKIIGEENAAHLKSLMSIAEAEIEAYDGE